VIVSPTALVGISILGFCELPGKMSRVIGDDVEPFEVFPCRKLELGMFDGFTEPLDWIIWAGSLEGDASARYATTG